MKMASNPGRKKKWGLFGTIRNGKQEIAVKDDLMLW